MEEFKSILLALGAAFAIALGALLLALLIKKPAEAFQEELKLPPEILKRIYPAWRYWAPFGIGFLFVSIEQFKGGPGASRRYLLADSGGFDHRGRDQFRLFSATMAEGTCRNSAAQTPRAKPRRQRRANRPMRGPYLDAFLGTPLGMAILSHSPP
jgi:hypothetical protein